MAQPALDIMHAQTSVSSDARQIRRGIAVLWVLVCAADLALPWSVGVGALYLLPGVLSLWLAGSSAPIWVAAGSSAWLALAAIGEPLQTELAGVLANRAIALFTIWTVAYLAVWRRGLEREVIESRDTLVTTLESIADPVITTGADGLVRFMNRAAEDVTGWSRDEAVGRALDDVFREVQPDQEDGPGADAEPGAPERTRETVLIDSEDRPIAVEVTTSWIRTAHPDQLGAQLGRVLVFRDIEQRKERLAAVERLAYRDPLTGLANRVSFFDRLELELAHSRRHEQRLALLFIDLDRFKEINDTYGHAAGDRYLTEFAERLRRAVRDADTVSRLAGDEFTVILPRVENVSNAVRVAEKIRLALSEPVTLDGEYVSTTPSIGIAMFPRDAKDADTLLTCADKAMYEAKARGGCAVHVWEHPAPGDEAARGETAHVADKED